MSNFPTPGPTMTAKAAKDLYKKEYSYSTLIDTISRVENYPEYEIIAMFHSTSYYKFFLLIANGLEDNTWENLDLEKIKIHTNVIMNCLILIKKYHALQLECAELEYSDKGFMLGEHKFQTLDEVEKAIKNKAFL